MIEPESGLGEGFNPNVSVLEPTFKRATKVWWWFYWRSYLLTLLGGVLVVPIVGFIRPAIGISDATVRCLVLILVTIVNIVASIFVHQSLLLKTFAEFKIRLVPTEVGRQIRTSP